MGAKSGVGRPSGIGVSDVDYDAIGSGFDSRLRHGSFSHGMLSCRTIPFPVGKTETTYEGSSAIMLRQSTTFTVLSTRTNGPRLIHENVLQSIIQSSPVCVYGGGNCSPVEDDTPRHKHRRDE
ncbi:hypothetical protein TNCV_1113691 [Trichonephila clavipes]|nr:hypothetical protein TNCV_1113691 [Trichonephila clavipes]